jgi:hypothetical protein
MLQLPQQVADIRLLPVDPSFAPLQVGSLW